LGVGGERREVMSSNAPKNLKEAISISISPPLLNRLILVLGIEQRGILSASARSRSQSEKAISL
jgi:hypothetical protein